MRETRERKRESKRDREQRETCGNRTKLWRREGKRQGNKESTRTTILDNVAIKQSGGLLVFVHL
jgi:hypothetical protein